MGSNKILEFSLTRKLINLDDFQELEKLMTELGIKLNNYIKLLHIN